MLLAPDLPGFGDTDLRPGEKYDAIGQAKRVNISKENSTVVDGAGTKEDITARVDHVDTRPARVGQTPVAVRIPYTFYFVID